jgi:hypothetical protein
MRDNQPIMQVGRRFCVADRTQMLTWLAATGQ